MGSSWASGNASNDARRSRERGQAVVEFALIAPLFLVIVVGIIQFGIGLNYWLDLQRIANQGARWAVVDHGWTRVSDGTQCTKTDTPASCLGTDQTLQDYLRSEPVSGGLQPKVKVCFDGTPDVGQPISVRMNTDFTFLPIMDLGEITLRSRASMRIEQPPTRYNEADNDGTC